MTWASISTATLGAAPHVRIEPFRAVSQHYDCLVMYVVTSPRLLSFSRGLTHPLEARLWQLLVCWASCLSSTTSTLYSPYSTLQLVWYSDFVATTTCLTHSRYCTGCVCQNGSILNWRLWHTECWTVCRHRISTNLFLYLACQVVAVCGRR